MRGWVFTVLLACGPEPRRPPLPPAVGWDTGPIADTSAVGDALRYSDPVDVTNPGATPEHHATAALGVGGWLIASAGFVLDEANVALPATAARRLSFDLEEIHPFGAPVVLTTKPDVERSGAGWLVAWQTEFNRVGVRRVGRHGAEGEPTMVGEVGDIQAGSVDLAVAPDGSGLLTWYYGDTVRSSDDPEPPDGEYRVVRVSAEGTLLGDVVTAFTTPPRDLSPPDVVALDDGAYAVAFQERYDARDPVLGVRPERLRMGLLDAMGHPTGAIVTVADGGLDGASRPGLAVDGQGRVGLTWRTGQDGATRSWVQVFRPDLSPLSEALEVAPGTGADRPVIAASASGWVLAWEHPLGTRAQAQDDRDTLLALLNPEGDGWRTAPAPPGPPAAERRTRPALAGRGGHTLLLTYESGEPDDTHIRAARVFVP